MEIIFTGDLCPHHRAGELLVSGRAADLFGTTLAVLTKADLSVVNLESPLTDLHSPQPKSGPHLVSPSGAAAGIAEAFDVACLANNHIFDQGAEGLAKTLEACGAAGITTTGAGLTPAAATQTLFIGDAPHSAAIINVADNEFIGDAAGAGAAVMEPIQVYRRIIAAKKVTPVVIVAAHGGAEHFELPTPELVRLFRFFIDAGASAVVTHHSHRASGIELYNGSPIFYGLGNFVFPPTRPQPDDWFEGHFAQIIIEHGKITSHSIIPHRQSRDGSSVNILEGAEAARYHARIAALSQLILEPKQLEERWRAHCSKHQDYYAEELLSLNRVARRLRKIFGTRRSAHLLTLLNFLRCAAHREAAVRALESESKLRNR